jgi:hypothetical protein
MPLHTTDAEIQEMFSNAGNDIELGGKDNVRWYTPAVPIGQKLVPEFYLPAAHLRCKP